MKISDRNESGSFSIPRPPKPDDEWKIDIERMPKVVKMPSLGEQRMHEDLEKLNKILEQDKIEWKNEVLIPAIVSSLVSIIMNLALRWFLR